MDFSQLPLPREVQSRILKFSQAPSAALIKNRTQEIKRTIDKAREKIALTIQKMERDAAEIDQDVDGLGDGYDNLVYIRDALSNAENVDKIVKSILFDTHFQGQLEDKFKYAVDGISSDNFVLQYVNGFVDEAYGNNLDTLADSIAGEIRERLQARRGGKRKRSTKRNKRTKRARKHNKSRRHRK